MKAPAIIETLIHLIGWSILIGIVISLVAAYLIVKYVVFYEYEKQDPQYEEYDLTPYDEPDDRIWNHR